MSVTYLHMCVGRANLTIINPWPSFTGYVHNLVFGCRLYGVINKKLLQFSLSRSSHENRGPKGAWQTTFKNSSLFARQRSHHLNLNAKIVTLVVSIVIIAIAEALKWVLSLT